MRRAVVFYTDLGDTGVAALRARYDPFHATVRDHVTLVFPLPDTVARDALEAHVREVASRWTPFRLHLAGLHRSWDNWLLLGAREGSDEVVRLHDELYAGPLADHLRTDLPYAPHVGLGLCTGEAYDPLDPKAGTCDEQRYRQPHAEAEALNLDVWRPVDRLTLVELDDDVRCVRDVAAVPLGCDSAREGPPDWRLVWRRP